MSSNGIKNVVGIAKDCAAMAKKLQADKEREREEFVASLQWWVPPTKDRYGYVHPGHIGYGGDVSGPDPLIDPAYRADQYAWAVEGFAKKGSEGFARQWAVRAGEALENALRIAEVDPAPVMDGLMTKYGVYVAQGELGEYMEEIKQ